MAKVPKAKNKAAQPGIRSRAARRAASPSLDVDKSLLSTSRPSESKDTTFSHSRSGIEKRQKKKKLTRQQRLRIEKGMERAEMNGDKLEKKVAESKGREKRTKSRAAAWEELNGKVGLVDGGRGDAFGKERNEDGAGKMEMLGSGEKEGSREEDKEVEDEEDEVL